MEDKQRFICFTIVALLIVAAIICVFAPKNVYDAYIQKDGVMLYWVVTAFDYEEFICSLSAIPELCK